MNINILVLLWLSLCNILYQCGNKVQRLNHGYFNPPIQSILHNRYFIPLLSHRYEIRSSLYRVCAATPPVRTGVVGVREDSNSTSPGEWDRQRRRIRMRNGREKTVGTSLLPLWGHVKTALRIREGGSYNSQKKPPVSLAPDNLSRGLRPFQPFHSVPIFSTPIIIVLDFFQVLFICRIRPRRQETERREGEGS